MLSVEVLAAEHEERALEEGAVLDVDEAFGVEGVAAVEGLEMEMGTGGAARGAAKPDEVSGRHDVAGTHLPLGKMRVSRFEAVRMPDYNNVAVTPVISGQAHDAVERSRHGSARRNGNVHSGVIAAAPSAIMREDVTAVRAAEPAFETYQRAFRNTVYRDIVGIEFGSGPETFYHLGGSLKRDELDGPGRLDGGMNHLYAVFPEKEEQSYCQ